MPGSSTTVPRSTRFTRRSAVEARRSAASARRSAVSARRSASANARSAAEARRSAASARASDAAARSSASRRRRSIRFRSFRSIRPGAKRGTAARGSTRRGGDEDTARTIVEDAARTIVEDAARTIVEDAARTIVEGAARTIVEGAVVAATAVATAFGFDGGLDARGVLLGSVRPGIAAPRVAGLRFTFARDAGLRGASHGALHGREMVVAVVVVLGFGVGERDVVESAHGVGGVEVVERVASGARVRPS